MVPSYPIHFLQGAPREEEHGCLASETAAGVTAAITNPKIKKNLHTCKHECDKQVPPECVLLRREYFRNKDRNKKVNEGIYPDRLRCMCRVWCGQTDTFAAEFVFSVKSHIKSS